MSTDYLWWICLRHILLNASYMTNCCFYRFLSICQLGGHSTFFGLLNTFVHIVMYSYYLFSALGEKYQKFLWWKKYLTALQMVRTFRLLCFRCDELSLYNIFQSRSLSITHSLIHVIECAVLISDIFFLYPLDPLYSNRFNLFWSWSTHSNCYSLTATTQERSSGGLVCIKFWLIAIE